MLRSAALALTSRLLLHRARLACVSRGFRRFCDAYATTCLRLHTELVVPFPKWERYIGGVQHCLAQHAAALQTVHIRFEVRRLDAPDLRMQVTFLDDDMKAANVGGSAGHDMCHGFAFVRGAKYPSECRPLLSAKTARVKPSPVARSASPRPLRMAAPGKIAGNA